MTQEEAKKLVPEQSLIKFSNSVFTFAGLQRMPGGIYFIVIYDEPPSYHTDVINPKRCEIEIL